MEINKLFKEYEPIKSIYEDDNFYYCVPETNKEPLIVVYDKEFKQYKTEFFFNNKIDLSDKKLIYGEDLFTDNF